MGKVGYWLLLGSGESNDISAISSGVMSLVKEKDASHNTAFTKLAKMNVVVTLRECLER